MASAQRLRFVTFLTLVRFPLILLFLAGAIVHTQTAWPWLFVVALSTLIGSAVTDLLDGYFARKLDVVTTFGEHVDPLMDKFYYVASLPLLVFVAAENGHTAHAAFLLVLTVLFLMRDQWVTFLRSIGAMHNVHGGAHWSGKLRTSINFPLICTVYYFEKAPPAAQFLNAGLVIAFEISALIVNMVSFVVYTQRYWPALRKSLSVETGQRPDSPS